MSSLWNKVADTFNRERNGTVPKAPSGSGTNHYLCEDGTWKEVESGVSSLSNLTDVNIASLEDGQILVYDQEQNKWVNADNQGGSGGSSVAHCYKCTGTILDGSTSSIKGWGLATVICANGVAQIYFNISKLSGSGSNSEWNWGINPNLLKSINSNIPTITPVFGGWWKGGSLGEGYATYLKPRDSGHWGFGRYYINGNANAEGDWESSSCGSSMLYGVCIGTYSGGGGGSSVSPISDDTINNIINQIYS